MISLLLLRVMACMGAIEYFTKGMQLRWFITDEEEVTFELWVPSLNLEGYDWIGFALQDVAFPSNDFQADYYIAMVDDVMTDRYADAHVLPQLDTDLGGTSDINADRFEFDGYTIYTVNRLFDTGDEYDTPLFFDCPYRVMWARGHIDESGILEHTLKDCGGEYLIMNGEYADRNHDDSGKFGPWTNEFHDFLNKVDHEALEEWTNLLEEEEQGIEDIEDDYATD